MVAVGLLVVLVPAGVFGLLMSGGSGRLEVPVAGLGQGNVNAPEQYLRGTQNYDAMMVWDSFSPEAQERFRSRGGSLEDLRRQMEIARQQGTRLESFVFIGSYNLSDGRSMQFYVVTSRGNLTRGEPEYIPYVFTLDRNGKILRVQ